VLRSRREGLKIYGRAAALVEVPAVTDKCADRRYVLPPAHPKPPAWECAMAKEPNDVADRVPDLPATETSDEVAEQVKGGGTDTSGRPPQHAPAPGPLNIPRAIDPCW
jgi:hypothetical protein